MTHETLIEKVKNRYAQADEATLQAVLLTLQDDAFTASLPPPTLPRETANEPARELSKPPLKFVGENPPPEAFRQLSFDERGELKLQLKARNWQWLEEKFANLHAAWIMVMDGEVIAFDDNLDSYPQVGQIREIGSRYGKRPFIFINDLFIAIEDSPFVQINPHRTALAGRDIFLKLQSAILLDFANRRTKITAPEQI